MDLLKLIAAAAVAVTLMTEAATAYTRCTTTGIVTRCYDSDTRETTRCTTTGSVTRCY